MTNMAKSGPPSCRMAAATSCFEGRWHCASDLLFTTKSQTLMCPRWYDASREEFKISIASADTCRSVWHNMLDLCFLIILLHLNMDLFHLLSDCQVLLCKQCSACALEEPYRAETQILQPGDMYPGRHPGNRRGSAFAAAVRPSRPCSGQA